LCEVQVIVMPKAAPDQRKMAETSGPCQKLGTNTSRTLRLLPYLKKNESAASQLGLLQDGNN
jgi:hypothetical protein